MELSLTMKRCVDFVKQNQNGIFRHPGGFWGQEKYIPYGKTGHFSTPTVEALVSRGLLKYTEWKEGRNGKFPIKAELI